MTILIITQDDPFYLADNIKYLINKLPEHSHIAAAVVLGVSPFGKRESFFEKAKKTYSIFGMKFFLYYTFRFLINKMNPNKDVRKIFRRYQIPILELEGNINHIDNLNKLKEYNPDLLVSIAGNQIFKRPLIELAPKGCINLHTALLPKYRGLMPSFWVLKNNEIKTGVSVFFVDEGIDSGPIIVQKEITIGDMSQEELIKKSKMIGMDSISEAIEKIERGQVKTLVNDASRATYFSFPTREDVRIFKKAGKHFF